MLRLSVARQAREEQGGLPRKVMSERKIRRFAASCKGYWKIPLRQESPGETQVCHSMGHCRVGRSDQLDRREQYGAEPICKVVPIAPSRWYEGKARENDYLRVPPTVRDDEILRAEIARV